MHAPHHPNRPVLRAVICACANPGADVLAQFPESEEFATVHCANHESLIEESVRSPVDAIVVGFSPPCSLEPGGILFFDVATFILAIGALLIVHVPQPIRTEEGAKASGGKLKEAAYGFKYIFARPSLLGLQLVFFAGNLFAGMAFTLLAPMILSRTNNNSLLYGSVQTAGAIAGLVGGVLMSVWGGFKRRVHGVLFGWIISGIGMAIIGLAGGLPIWITGLAISSVVIPLMNGSNQAIWQSKVAPDLQGRVFASRRLIAWITNPISPIIAGTPG